MMLEKVLKCGIKREKGYLYYIDVKGDVLRKKLGNNKNKPELVKKARIKRVKGFTYFIDKEGDISREDLILEIEAHM